MAHKIQLKRTFKLGKPQTTVRMTIVAHCVVVQSSDHVVVVVVVEVVIDLDFEVVALFL